MFEDVLKQWGAVEASAMEVYSDIFSLGYGEIQRSGEERGFKTNPLAVGVNNDKAFRRVMLEDTFEDTLKELQEADFAILNGLTYFGRKNTAANANKMYALIFDIDGITDKTLNAFLSGAYRAGVYPIPNYIALSGHGIHLYYKFEYGIPLYPNIKLQLKELKYALTTKMWNLYTSTIENRQYQGINQGFRVIGGKTKIEGVRVRAFRLNTTPFCLDMLNEFVPDEHRIDESKLWRETKYTLEEAKKKFPEWYERIVLGKQPAGSWTIKRDLYNWWIRQIKAGATINHRYFCIMALAIYAAKCEIEFDELLNDALELMPFLNEINPEDPFTEYDIDCALECYDPKYKRFPRKDIEKITNITIPPGKRNYQKREWHLEDIRDKKKRMKRRGQSFKNPEGRPSAEQQVVEWRSMYPNGKKADCIRYTGLTKPTVYKWWDSYVPKVAHDTEGHIVVPVRPSEELNKLLLDELRKLDEE